jgi:hypothetical protein
LYLLPGMPGKRIPRTKNPQDFWLSIPCAFPKPASAPFRNFAVKARRSHAKGKKVKSNALHTVVMHPDSES